MKRRVERSTLAAMLGLASLGACTIAPRDDGLTGVGVGETAEATGGTGVDGEGTTIGTGGTGTSDDTGATGDDAKFDVGSGVDTGGADDGGNQTGCRGIDFLFVIDNSGSMSSEQSNLANSVPGFLETMKETVDDEAEAFHVLVAATAVEPFNPESGCSYACEQAGNPPDIACDGVPCDQWPPYVEPPTPCWAKLGAGRRKSGADIECGLPEGVHFVHSDHPDLDEAFTCMANVGEGFASGDEKPMLAMNQAVGALASPGECNEGFLRDDAILVVTFITDEDDDHPNGESIGSPGDPPDWYDDLLAAKDGDPSGIVVLGLIGDTDQPGAVCEPYDPETGDGAEGSPRLRQFVESFGDRGAWGSVCAPDYAPFFAEAVDLIDTACDDYLPEG